MIVSKPKVSTLLSLGFFLILAFSLGGINLRIILTSTNPSWYHYLISSFLLPLGTIITFKQLWGFKTVRVQKEKLIINYPFRFNKVNRKLREVTKWGETKVGTKSGTFRELTVLFETGNNLKMTLQENSKYEEVFDYLKKKLPKKRHDV